MATCLQPLACVAVQLLPLMQHVPPAARAPVQQCDEQVQQRGHGGAAGVEGVHSLHLQRTQEAGGGPTSTQCLGYEEQFLWQRAVACVKGGLQNTEPGWHMNKGGKIRCYRVLSFQSSPQALLVVFHL